MKTRTTAFLLLVVTTSTVFSDQRAQKASLTLPGVDIYCVRFHPNGDWIAACCSDGRVLSIDPRMGRIVKVVDEGKGAALSLAFGLRGQILAVSRNGVVRILDIAKKQENAGVAATVKGYFVAFAPNDKLLASTDEAAVHLWNMPTGTRRLTITTREKVIRNVAFSSNNSIVAICPTNATILLCDATSGKTLFTLKGHAGFSVIGLAFSPDGGTLATGGSDNTVRLWDVATAKAIATLKGHTNVVQDVAFSPNGRLIASAGWDRTVRIWDAKLHKEKACLRGHKAGVYSVSFSPDGKSCVSSSGDSGRFGEVMIWSLPQNR